MLLAPLPFDYLQHLERSDRLRRTRMRPTGSRVRRVSGGKTGE
jgi:hypothetical protein